MLYIELSAADKNDLTCEIIYMVISHAMIIADSALRFNAIWGGGGVVWQFFFI